MDKLVDRRDVLRMLAGGLIAVTASSTLTGCGGGGGSSSGSPSGSGGGPANPNIDQTSSYTAFNTAAHSDLWVPRPNVLTYGAGFLNAIAYGDVNGDGIVEVIVAASASFPEPAAGTPIQIFQPSGSSYTDITAQVITGTIPVTYHARKVIVADFNGDGHPDVYIADHGFDFPPYPGAHDILLLSDGAGHLVPNANSKDPIGFHHGAAAGDTLNNGVMNIFVTDNVGPSPYFLMNDGHGNFTEDRGRVPGNLAHKGLFSAELIDIDGDGFLDLIVGGNEPDTMPTTIYWGDGTGNYRDSNKTILPAVASYGIALGFAAEDLNGNGLRDIVVTRTSFSPSYVGFYLQVIMQTAKRTFSDETQKRLIPDPANWVGANSRWIDWTRLVSVNGSARPGIRLDDASRGLQWTNDGNGFFTQV